MFLATLATLNFSLAFLVGLLAAPLSFTGEPFSTSSTELAQSSRTRKVLLSVLLQFLSPPAVVLAVCKDGA